MLGKPKPVRVLLIEDSRVQREIIRATLTQMGYYVEGVETGEEALERYAVGKYDVLLVDVMLPGIGGLEVLDRIRKQDMDQCTILMTAEGSGISAVGAVRAGADDYVTKPIFVDRGGADLEVIISRSLERRRLERENRELQQKLIEADRLNAVMHLAGATAHEMNQPLTVIMGMLDLLVIDVQEGQQINGDVEVLRRAAIQLSEIVKKLGTITTYRTKPYVEGTSILDLRGSTKEEA